jgi:hypothetical protein
MVIDDAPGGIATGLSAYHARLRFDGSVLIPQMPFLDARIDGNERVVTVAGMLPTDRAIGVCTTFPFLTALGERPCSTVRIDSLWCDTATLPVEVEPAACEICVRVCREGGERLFSSRGPVAGISVHPNPFNASTVIDYTTVERGLTQVAVMDVLGRVRALLVDRELEPGGYRVSFNASDLSSGLYNCVLRTPSLIRMEMMIVVK